MYFRLRRLIIPLYVFLFSFFLSTQLGKHFFFPFSYLSGIRIDYLSITLSFLDIMSLPFIFYFIKKSISSHPFRGGFFVYAACILCILNFLYSLSIPLWLCSAFRVLQWVSIFFFFRSQAKNKHLFSSILLGLLAGALFQLILTLMQLSARESVQGIFYYVGERRFSIFTPGIAKAYFLRKEFLRPYGTFSHPNSLAGFYLLIYTFVLTQKRVTNSTFKSILLILSSMLVLISFSRSSIVVYGAINLLYVMRNSFTCKVCVFAKIVCAFVLILFALSIGGDINSLQKRNDFAQKSLIIIASKPLTGTGIGSYLIAQHAYPQKFSTFFEQPVHNIFLLAIAQLGVPLCLLLFVFVIHRIKPKMKNAAFALPLLVVLLTGSIDHYWITLQQNVFATAVIFGILSVYEAKTSSS